jgi:hypothetical protein
MYGHNMEYDDVLFGQLNKLKSLDYLQAHPAFTFDTLYQAGQWKVLAVCRASTDELATFPYNRTTLTDENDFRSHLYQFRIRSMFRIPDDGGPLRLTHADDQSAVSFSHGFLLGFNDVFSNSIHPSDVLIDTSIDYCYNNKNNL